MALQFECDIVGALEKNNLEGAFNMYMEAKLIFEREKGSRSITELVIYSSNLHHIKNSRPSY